MVSDRLTADLDWLPPGMMLAAALDRIDRDLLSGHDRVTLLRARARQIAHDQAELLADIQSISAAVSEQVDVWNDDPLFRDQAVFDTTSTEISAALSLTRRASEIQVGLADDLSQQLPQVWKALSEGLIDLTRARVLADQTCHLPQDLAGRVCDKALEQASAQTTGQLRARIQHLIISIDPAAAKTRYEEKLKQARVVCEPTVDGTANLYGLDLAADRANRAMKRISRMAHTRKRNGDRRPIDQIRADIYLDLLSGPHSGQDSPGEGIVDIRVELSTLLELDEKPAQIPGWGPVIADIARQVAANTRKGTYRVAVTHLDQLHDLITTKRRPTTEQKRVVQVLNPECVFPTCRIGSADCDIDHQLPWAQHHRTTINELEPLCPHHNQTKEHGWKLHQTRPGTYQWTSPLGHTYTTEPNGPDPP